MKKMTAAAMAIALVLLAGCQSATTPTKTSNATRTMLPNINVVV